MKRIHFSFMKQPQCMVVTTGKKYELTTDRIKVTCKACLKAIGTEFELLTPNGIGPIKGL